MSYRHTDEKTTSNNNNTLQPARRYERPGLSTEEIEELQEAFNLFDSDGSGSIDAGELRQAMESLGYKQKNKMVYQMIENMGRREINFDQFLDMMTARISDSDNRDDILKVFKLFDDDESGHINISDLQRVARELGESMSPGKILLFDNIIILQAINII